MSMATRRLPPPPKQLPKHGKPPPPQPNLSDDPPPPPLPARPGAHRLPQVPAPPPSQSPVRRDADDEGGMDDYLQPDLPTGPPPRPLPSRGQPNLPPTPAQPTEDELIEETYDALDEIPVVMATEEEEQEEYDEFTVKSAEPDEEYEEPTVELTYEAVSETEPAPPPAPKIERHAPHASLPPLPTRPVPPPSPAPVQTSAEEPQMEEMYEEVTEKQTPARQPEPLPPRPGHINKPPPQPPQEGISEETYEVMPPEPSRSLPDLPPSLPPLPDRPSTQTQTSPSQSSSLPPDNPQQETYEFIPGQETDTWPGPPPPPPIPAPSTSAGKQQRPLPSLNHDDKPVLPSGRPSPSGGKSSGVQKKPLPIVSQFDLSAIKLKSVERPDGGAQVKSEPGEVPDLGSLSVVQRRELLEKASGAASRPALKEKPKNLRSPVTSSSLPPPPVPPIVANSHKKYAQQPEPPLPPPPSAASPVNHAETNSGFDDCEELYDEASSTMTNPLMKYGWYHAGIDRTKSKTLLAGVGKDGTFLVRDSSQSSAAQPYTLVVWYQSHDYNLKLRVRSDGKVAIGEAKAEELAFEDVPALINHHRENNVILMNSKQKMTSHTMLTDFPERQ